MVLDERDLQTREQLERLSAETILAALRNPSGLSEDAVIKLVHQVEERTLTEAGLSLLELLRNATPSIQAVSLDAAVALGLREAVPLASKFLDDPAAPVFLRDTAAYALGHLDAQEAIPQLIRVGTDPAVEVSIRRCAWGSLTRLSKESEIREVDLALNSRVLATDLFLSASSYHSKRIKHEAQEAEAVEVATWRRWRDAAGHQE